MVRVESRFFKFAWICYRPIPFDCRIACSRAPPGSGVDRPCPSVADAGCKFVEFDMKGEMTRLGPVLQVLGARECDSRRSSTSQENASLPFCPVGRFLVTMAVVIQECFLIITFHGNLSIFASIFKISQLFCFLELWAQIFKESLSVSNSFISGIFGSFERYPGYPTSYPES